jgi:hypothetical protein
MNKNNELVIKFMEVYSYYYNPDLNKYASYAYKCAFSCIAELIPDNTILNYIKQNEIKLDSRNSLLFWMYNLRLKFGLNISYNEYYRILNDMSKDMTTWSHPTWNIIHYIPYINEMSFAHSNAQRLENKDNKDNNKWDKTRKNIYKSFISCLQYILICSKCRAHLQENLSQDHIDSYIKNGNLLLWSINLHNIVNKSLNYPILDYNTAYDKITKI